MIILRVHESRFPPLSQTNEGASCFQRVIQRVNVAKGTLETAITMFMTGPTEQKGYQMAKVDPRSTCS